MCCPAIGDGMFVAGTSSAVERWKKGRDRERRTFLRAFLSLSARDASSIVSRWCHSSVCRVKSVGKGAWE